MELEGSLPHIQKPFTCPNPVHCPPSHFLTILLNIIIPSMYGVSQWSPYLRFPHQNTAHTSTLPYMFYIPHPPHSDLNTQILIGDQYISLGSSLCSFLHLLFASSLLSPNIPLSTLFSNTYVPISL